MPRNAKIRQSKAVHIAGGHRRSVYLPCGKCIRGHPKRIQTAINLHHKTCKTCKDSKKFVSNSISFDDTNQTDFRDAGDYQRRNKDILVNGWREDGEGRGQEWVNGSHTDSNEFRNEIWGKYKELDTPELSKDEKKRKRKAEQKARKKVRDKMKLVLEDIVNGIQLSASTTNPRPEIDLDYDSDDEFKKAFAPQTCKEQMVKRLGDCVKSTFVHMYLDWKDTGMYRLHQYSYITMDLFEQMFDGAERGFIAHHLTYNPDKGRIYDFSNGRSICFTKEKYDEHSHPPPIAEHKGKTLDIIRDEAKVWAGELVGCDGAWDKRWSDMITYVYMEAKHSALLEELEVKTDDEGMKEMAIALKMVKEFYKVADTLVGDVSNASVNIVIENWLEQRQ